MAPPAAGKPLKPKPHPFRQAVLRGLAIVMPPLLTVVLIMWLASTVKDSVLRPVENGVRAALVWQMADIRATLPDATPATDNPDVFVTAEGPFRKVAGRFVPLHVYEVAEPYVTPNASASDVYHAYVERRYLQPYVVIPVFLLLFVLVLYFLGKFLAAGIGRAIWNVFERGVNRLPLVRNVYSSVKQVTDFVFTEKELEFTRVVAIEYPRRGIWSLGFVTSESLLDITAAANEPLLAVLIPSSPMPVTGYTITIKKSEAVDLDLTIDQAIQFVVSCGVVVPPHQLPRRAQAALVAGASQEPGQ